MFASLAKFNSVALKISLGCFNHCLGLFGHAVNDILLARYLALVPQASGHCCIYWTSVFTLFVDVGLNQRSKHY